MKRPLIGIGADLKAGESARNGAFGYLSYVDALLAAGAIPVFIPPRSGTLHRVVERLDGIVLTGGDDCDPAQYGEAPHPTVKPMARERQENDLTLASLARSRGIPLFGVCLGMQIMSIEAGGKLIQDIRSEVPSALQHESEPGLRARHEVVVEPGTRLAQIVGEGRHDVNSSHHQAVRSVGPALQVTARAADGIIEAVEDPAHPFFLGVQWHPEDMTAEESGRALFEAFVNAAREHALQRDMQGGVLSE